MAVRAQALKVAALDESYIVTKASFETGLESLMEPEVCRLASIAVRIPVKWATNSADKWATYSGGMWAGVRRASRRCKNMMAKVAHISQEKSEIDRHLVSIISFPSSRLPVGFRRDVGHHSGDVGQPEMVASRQLPVVPLRLRERLTHSRSIVRALRRMYAQ